MTPLPTIDGGFRCIVADPPWSYRDKGSRISPDQRSALVYPTMSTPDIAALRVEAVSAEDAFLLLWTTDAHLLDGSAAHVATSWGFEPKRIIVWVKRGLSGKLAFGAGHYVRGAHELVVLCRRGKAHVRQRNERSVFEAPRSQHSKKPDALLDLAERLTPGPYLELFARRHREGWVAWGNQLDPGEVAA